MALTFEVVSSASQKDPDTKWNEDAFGFTNHAAWVLDGASGPGGASRVTHEFVEAASSALGRLADRHSSREALRRAIIASADRVPAGVPAPTASVCLASLRGRTLRFASLGDVTLLARGPGYLLVATDFASVEREQRRLASVDGDLGRYWQTAARVRESANTGSGYWIFSTDPRAARHARRGRLEISAGDDIVLMSDGATRAVDLFHLMSWSELMDRTVASGVSGLIELVRAAELKDHDRRRFPRVKVRDDATAIHLRAT